MDGADATLSKWLRVLRVLVLTLAAWRRCSERVLWWAPIQAYLTSMMSSHQREQGGIGPMRVVRRLVAPDALRTPAIWPGPALFSIATRWRCVAERLRSVVPASSKLTPSLTQPAYIQFSDLYCMAQPQHCRGVILTGTLMLIL